MPHEPSTHAEESAVKSIISKPLIGLTGRRGTGNILGAPTGFSDSPLDVYMSEYATSVIQAGGLPVHLALDSDPADLVDHLDAIVLSGGSDVDSRRYGQPPGPHTGPFDPQRDEFEFQLVEAALERGIPVLGICRGAQLINVALGGTLIQHLTVGNGESHASYAYPRAHRAHEVELLAGSVASGLYGSRVAVNSFHHQAVDEPGTQVVPTGWSADGVIEAFEVADKPILGVQWHPECFGTDPIFTWLVTASLASLTSQYGKTA